MTADLTFNYLAGDVQGTESSYYIAKYSSGWSFPGGSVDAANNQATITGVSSFSDWTLAEGDAPTAVMLSSFTATEYEEGVLLFWRTGHEVNNLGFHVYREEEGRRTRINPQMIAGSALRAGQGINTAGHSYSWLDTVSGPLPALSQEESRERGGGPGWGGLSSQSSPLSPVRYWLEDIDLSGKRTWHGPIPPVFSDGPLPKRTQAVLLSHLNRQSARARGVRTVRRERKALNSALSTRDSAPDLFSRPLLQPSPLFAPTSPSGEWMTEAGITRKPGRRTSPTDPGKPRSESSRS